MSIRVPIVGILLVAACATAAWLISRLDVPPSPTPSETAERSTTATGYTLPDSMILENDRVRLVRMPDSIPMPGVGARAPDFELTSLHGGRFELTEHVGEVVVLNFWATWCEPCHDEMPDLQMTHDSLGGRGVTVVGVSIDEEGRDVVHPFHQTYPVAFPLLLNGLDVAREYGAAYAVPTTIVVDREGRIADHFIGAQTVDELLPRLRAHLDRAEEPPRPPNLLDGGASEGG